LKPLTLNVNFRSFSYAFLTQRNKGVVKNDTQRNKPDTTKIIFTQVHVTMGVGRGGKDPLDLEIWHFSVTHLAKKVVLLVSRRKN